MGGDSPFKNLPIPPFSHATVLSRFQKLRDSHPGQHIATTLMNQDVFCGVGQVEKIEALYHSRVHPEEPLRNVGDALAKQLILWIRAFDERWMACQKNKFEARTPMNKGSGHLLPPPEVKLCYLNGSSD
ncbi:hypothetical protein TrRE_jg3378, partial [Triparma retinervis]